VTFIFGSKLSSPEKGWFAHTQNRSNSVISCSVGYETVKQTRSASGQVHESKDHQKYSEKYSLESGGAGWIGIFWVKIWGKRWALLFFFTGDWRCSRFQMLQRWDPSV
jgi:hypothetical protein